MKGLCSSCVGCPACGHLIDELAEAIKGYELPDMSTEKGFVLAVREMDHSDSSPSTAVPG